MLRHLKYIVVAHAFLAAVSLAAPDDPELLCRLVADLNSLHRVTAAPHRMADSTATSCSVASYNTNIHEGENAPAYCHVYVTPGAREPMTTGRGVYPRGSVIVKAKLNSERSSNAVLYTVMRKMPQGYDDKHGDWEYAVLDGSSKRVVARGKIDSCIECHKEHASADYVTRAYMSPK